MDTLFEISCNLGHSHPFWIARLHAKTQHSSPDFTSNNNIDFQCSHKTKNMNFSAVALSSLKGGSSTKRKGKRAKSAVDVPVPPHQHIQGWQDGNKLMVMVGNENYQDCAPILFSNVT